MGFRHSDIIPAMSPGDTDGDTKGDSALAERARGGERDAFEEIFLLHRGQVFSVAYRMTGNYSDAEDICQEVFLKTMRKIGSFQGRSTLSTWLYRVAVNVSKDHLRKKKRSAEVLRGEDTPETEVREVPPPRQEGEPESRALELETRQLVQEALLELPLSLRVPLVLHELEGLEYDQISRMLRLPVGTVKSRIFRSRIKLAEILAPYKEQWG
jgi:RNA polymerase sigma-70 factor (ECF subfamily)